MVLQGNPETKNLKDMMPEILKQVGPKQMAALKDIISSGAGAAGQAAAEDNSDDDDQPPPLVGGNF